MSIGVMTWVWTHSRSRNGARLVLLAIADSANDNGRNAWPSVKTLRTKANLSERAVQSAIKELVALGELKVGWNKGPHGSNLYSITMQTPAESAPPQILHPADSAGVEDGTEPDTDPQDPPQNLHPAESAPPQISTETPAESAPEPSLNRPSTSSTKKSSSPPAKSRGTRIPEDFSVTPAMIAWFCKTAPGFDGPAVTEAFVDHWRADATPKALKLDWEAAWRTWVRNAVKWDKPSKYPPKPTPQERLAQSQQIVEDMRRLDEAEASGQAVTTLFQLPPGRTA